MVDETDLDGEGAVGTEGLVELEAGEEGGGDGAGLDGLEDVGGEEELVVGTDPQDGGGDGEALVGLQAEEEGVVLGAVVLSGHEADGPVQSLELLVELTVRYRLRLSPRRRRSPCSLPWRLACLFPSLSCGHVLWCWWCVLEGS